MAPIALYGAIHSLNMLSIGVCTVHTVLWSRDTILHIRDGPQNITNPFEF